MAATSSQGAAGARFAPLPTTDDDEAADDGGPPTTYRDADVDVAVDEGRPIHRNNRGEGDDGPPVRYRDDPGSIFDWGGDDVGENGGGTAKATGGGSGSDAYRIDDEFDRNSVGFSPVSLHDDDDDDDDEDGDEEHGGGLDDSDVDRLRRNAKNLVKRRIFDDTRYDDADERIFVGGGWGRHGAQFSVCPRGLGGWCCGPPAYSRGPSSGGSLGRTVCLGLAFAALVFGAGCLGYQAGLPATEKDASDGEMGDDDSTAHNVHTRGEEWLHWLEQEKDDIRAHRWNFTFHHPKERAPAGEAFRKSHFEPQTQAELLRLSEEVFQSCSERSLRTQTGREACLSLCHGHYCCFEKDVKYGSCVAEPNSYCFAFAACENAIGDFGMNNANPASKGVDSAELALNAVDKQLLAGTCSKENIATLEGIRDCTAFCQHHLCCFNGLAAENCKNDHEDECAAYGSCGILVYGPDEAASAAAIPINNDKGKSDGTAATQVTFKEQCNVSNLRQNWDLCYRHCTRFECCFRGGADSCYEERTLECDEYAICEEFFLDDDVAGDVGNNIDTNKAPSSGQGTYDHSSANVNKDIETAVHAVCGLEDEHPGDDSWVAACHALCANYLCCFSTDGTESNCRDTYGDALCNAYQGCVVLHASAENDSASSSRPPGTANDIAKDEVAAVTKACVPKARRDPWLADECRKACDARSCCFAPDPGNCMRMEEEWCDAFHACELLYT